MTKEGKEGQEMTQARLSLLISNVGMRALRLLFRERYKALMSKELENGKLEISPNEEFLRKHGSNKLDFMKEHEGAKSSSDINKWDFERLFHTLNFGMGLSAPRDGATDQMIVGPRPSKRAAEKKQKREENEALRVLWNIRNSLLLGTCVSGQNNSTPDGDLVNWWDTARDALLRLGAHEKDIEHIRSCELLDAQELSTTTTTTTPVTSEDEESKTKTLRYLQVVADKCIAEGDYNEGIVLWSEALLVRQGLSPQDKSWIHSSRSQALLTQLEWQKKVDTLSDESAVTCMDLAMDDARYVIQLEPESWKGYFLEGRIFQLWKLFKEAIDSFEVALTLKPYSEAVEVARSECRLDMSDIESQINSDPIFIPAKLSEMFKSREEIQERFREHEEMMNSKDRAERVRGSMFMGHRHQLGDEAPLDPGKATELFWRAAKEGSPEGAYFAGLNVLRGIGTEKDIPKAVIIFQQAANYPMKAGSEHLLHNEAIAKSKTIQAMFYQHGVGVDRDYNKAAQFYTWAVAGGSGVAAMNLARMYYWVGMGMAKNIKKALQYQRLAVELGTGGAAGMHFLGRLYAEIGNLSQARYWSSRATTSGYSSPLLERQDFDDLLQHKEQEFGDLKKKLPAHVLSSKSPIHVLHERYAKRIGPALDEFKKLHEDVAHDRVNAAFGDPVRAEPNPTEVRQFAADGQEYARLSLKALEAVNKLLAAGAGKEDSSQQKKSDLKTKLGLAEIAACYTAGVDPAASMSTESRRTLMDVALELIRQDGERSDSDLAARVCRLNLLMSSADDAVLGFAGECKSLYPKEPHFFERYSYALGLLKKQEEGVRVAEEALKTFPNNWGLLYVRAQHLFQIVEPHSSEEVTGLGGSHSSGGTSQDESSMIAGGKDEIQPQPGTSKFISIRIQAYQEFLRNAPSGHPNIPEAHYRLALLYERCGNIHKVVVNYEAGAEAEEGLLSHFLPYESPVKEAAETFLRKTTEVRIRYKAYKELVLDHLWQYDQEEVKETRRLKLSPKRILTATEFRRRLISGEVTGSGTEKRVLIERAGFIFRSRPAVGVGGQHKQRGPTPQKMRSSISSLPSTFEELDPTIDQVHRGRVINLTIMEEYIEGSRLDPIQTIVKDENDDFNLILFYNFERNDPSTSKKLSHGSRIRLMNPHLSLSEYGRLVVRVDDPSSVLFLSSGEENAICRYCWEPNPKPRCTKCKVAQYCDKECQTRDWEVLGHKELCKVLRKCQQKPLGK